MLHRHSLLTAAPPDFHLTGLLQCRHHFLFLRLPLLLIIIINLFPDFVLHLRFPLLLVPPPPPLLLLILPPPRLPRLHLRNPRLHPRNPRPPHPRIHTRFHIPTPLPRPHPAPLTLPLADRPRLPPCLSPIKSF